MILHDIRVAANEYIAKYNKTPKNVYLSPHDCTLLMDQCPPEFGGLAPISKEDSDPVMKVMSLTVNEDPDLPVGKIEVR